MPRIIYTLIAVLMLALASPGQAQTVPGGGVRVALVIGNSAYHSAEKLANPQNDARIIAERLQALGFTLVGDGPQIDLDKPAFEQAVADFRQKMRRADIALFFYAGHGVQIGGVNWLVPVSAAPRVEADVAAQMIDANTVLAHMRAGGAKLNVVILDACRDNPFPPSTAAPQPQPAVPTKGGGLGRMDAPDNTIIAYATQPGNVALDGTSGNSPYSKALAEAIGLPGLEIRRVFNDVGVRVRRATGGAQQPWVSTSPIEREFFLAGRSSASATQVAAPDVVWAVGTWRGPILEYPRSNENYRAYMVSQVDGRLHCAWQTHGAAPIDTPCLITSVDVTITPNAHMQRAPGETLSGTYRQPNSSAVYKIELKRFSAAIVAWPYFAAPTKASAETKWLVGVWVGQIQAAPKGRTSGRELKVEVIDDVLKCSLREPAQAWASAPCDVVDRKVTVISGGGTNFALALTGKSLTGALRFRNEEKTHVVALQKIQ